MRMQDTLTIAEFGNFIIEAVYDYRIDTSYGNKHAPVSAEDIKVEKIELVIKKHQSVLDRKTNTRTNTTRTLRTIRHLDIPPWLWDLLIDEETLSELDMDTSHNEPDEQDAADAADSADDRRDY